MDEMQYQNRLEYERILAKCDVQILLDDLCESLGWERHRWRMLSIGYALKRPVVKRAGGEDWHFPVRIHLPGDPELI